jgi:predicted Zn-dependent peptidase
MAAEDKEGKIIAALQEYKKLLDSGVLTQEEFEQKKQQLLGQQNP